MQTNKNNISDQAFDLAFFDCTQAYKLKQSGTTSGCSTSHRQ